MVSSINVCATASSSLGQKIPMSEDDAGSSTFVIFIY